MSSKIKETSGEPSKMSTEDSPEREMMDSHDLKLSRDHDSMGVTSKVDHKKLNETQKFSLSQTSLISITPMSSKNEKKKEEEVFHTTPSPRPKIKSSPKLNIRQWRQKF